MPEGDIEIIKNDRAHQFEVAIGEHVAKLAFDQDGDTIIYPHTEVPKELGGRGIAGKMAAHALDYARANNLRVVPQCPFVKKYIEDHPEYQDLV